MDPRIDRFIDTLRSVRRRKRMYLGAVDVASAENFLNGFKVACQLCEFDVPPEVHARVTFERGWTWCAKSPADEMRGLGLTEEAIVDELLALEIAAWERWRDGPD